MSSRKSPLSLKARAIALLAQREHSVEELRRKLLVLAQQRDLKAWDDAQAAADGRPRGVADGVADGVANGAADEVIPGVRPDAGLSAATNGPGGPGLGGRAHTAGIGSFDLDEDWDDGELEAFLDEWGESPSPAQASMRSLRMMQEMPELSPEAMKDRQPSPRRTGGETATSEARRRAISAGDLPRSLGDANVTPEADDRMGAHAPGVTSTRSSHRSSKGRAAASGRPIPSPQARAAVMEEESRLARAEEVEQLLQWLQQRDYLSEARLVESRINARASRYGNLRIRQELRQLGVAADEEQQAQLRDSEFDRAREVWRRKFGGELPEDAASRARQMRFLAARGFSAEVVRRVLRAPDE